MAGVSGSETKPEKLVRKYLFAAGFRFRKNVSGLPGRPDIVLRKYKLHRVCEWMFLAWPWKLFEGYSSAIQHRILVRKNSVKQRAGQESDRSITGCRMARNNGLGVQS